MARLQDGTGLPREPAKMHPVQFPFACIGRTIPGPAHLTSKKDAVCSFARSLSTTRIHGSKSQNAAWLLV
jgi:hypothetical protein